MNRFILQGFISAVKYLPDSCLVFVDQFEKGYRKANGESVPDQYLTWCVVFNDYFKNYIAKHFNNGMLVNIVATMKPYALDHGKQVEGYSCLGKTIDLASYPRATVKQELRMMRESQEASDEAPDVDTFYEPDF